MLRWNADTGVVVDEAGVVSPEMVRTLKIAQATGSVTIVMNGALHDWRRGTSEDKKSLVASNRSSESCGAEGGGRARRDDRAFAGDAPLTRRDDRSLTPEGGRCGAQRAASGGRADHPGRNEAAADRTGHVPLRR